MESLKRIFKRINFIIETKDLIVVDGQINGEHVVQDIEKPIPYHKTQQYAEQYGVEDGCIHFGSELMEDGHIHHHVDTELAELQAKGIYINDNYVK